MAGSETELASPSRPLTDVNRRHFDRVVVFGDSIADGLGARGREFPVVVAEALSAELVRLCGTAKMVDESVQGMRDCRRGDLVVIMHGITEAIPRVPAERLRWVPRRWSGPARMDPRPYYSTRRPRRILERADSSIRWRVKRLLMREGSVVMMEADVYERLLAVLVESTARVADKVIVVAGAPIEDRYYPGGASALERYSELSRAVARRQGVAYVDVSPHLRRWEDFLADGFHPSSDGHLTIAQLILREVDGD